MARRPPPSLNPPPAPEIGSALRIVEALLVHDRDVDEVAAQEGLSRQHVAFRLIAMQAGIDAVLSEVFKAPPPHPFTVPEARH